MKNFLKVLLIALILAIAGYVGFYFRSDIALYFEKLPEVTRPTFDIVNDLAKKTGNVLAPDPLRIEKYISGTPLTSEGIIAFTNENRVKNGLPALAPNKQLEQAAILKVNDMFSGQYFEHISPSGNGPAYFVDSSGYAYIMIGENLALGNFDGDEDLVNAWMNSPGHRENILHKSFEEIGVAARKGTFEGKTVWLAVQEFGRPVSSCPAVDKEMKEQLDKYTTDIQEMDPAINNLLVELRMLKKSGDREEYNKKVVEYNELVNSYNLLVSRTKELTTVYNAQVSAYNTCLAAE